MLTKSFLSTRQAETLIPLSDTYLGKLQLFSQFPSCPPHLCVRTQVWIFRPDTHTLNEATTPADHSRTECRSCLCYNWTTHSLQYLAPPCSLSLTLEWTTSHGEKCPTTAKRLQNIWPFLSSVDQEKTFQGHCPEMEGVLWSSSTSLHNHSLSGY